jgi:hypothetical protein
MMNQLKLQQMRENIDAAHREESRNGVLLHFLATVAPRLHRTIRFTGERPAQNLIEFIGDYIQQVPDFIEAVNAYLDNTAETPAEHELITIAVDFFLQAPTQSELHTGLLALVDKAYFAHRLIEELSDRVLIRCGVGLMPVDMTLSNIVIHDILGEEYANQLDLAVHFAVESFLGNKVFAAAVVRESHTAWEQLLRKWPRLKNQPPIELDLSAPVDEAAEKLH